MIPSRSRLLAAAAVLCLFAGGASAQGIHVSYYRLHLDDPRDAAEFKSRVDYVATSMCERPGAPDTRSLKVCHQAVWDETISQLPDTTRRDLQQALAGKTELASNR